VLTLSDLLSVSIFTGLQSRCSRFVRLSSSENSNIFTLLYGAGCGVVSSVDVVLDLGKALLLSGLLLLVLEESEGVHARGSMLGLFFHSPVVFVSNLLD